MLVSFPYPSNFHILTAASRNSSVGGWKLNFLLLVVIFLLFSTPPAVANSRCLSYCLQTLKRWLRGILGVRLPFSMFSKSITSLSYCTHRTWGRGFHLYQLFDLLARIPDYLVHCSHTLDLVLASILFSFSNITLLSSMGSSDHCIISLSIPWVSPPICSHWPMVGQFPHHPFDVVNVLVSIFQNWPHQLLFP